MEHPSTEAQKRKRSLPRQWGCLRFLLIPIVIIAVCYGGMWVFAHYGSEWALSDQVSVPPGSELIEVALKDAPFENEFIGNYVSEYRLYLHSGTPEELRTWFEKEDILFLPKCLDVPDQDIYRECYESRPLYYGRSQKRPDNFKVQLYLISLLFSGRMRIDEDLGWKRIPIKDLVVSIYDNQEEFDATSFYPGSDIRIFNIDIPDHRTAFMVEALMPRKIEWLFYTPDR